MNGAMSNAGWFLAGVTATLAPHPWGWWLLGANTVLLGIQIFVFRRGDL